MRRILLLGGALLACCCGSAIARQQPPVRAVPETHAVIYTCECIAVVETKQSTPNPRRPEPHPSPDQLFRADAPEAYARCAEKPLNPDARVTQAKHDGSLMSVAIESGALKGFAAEPYPTLLMYAVYYGDTPLVRKMLKLGANVRASGGFIIRFGPDHASDIAYIATGITALHLAAASGNPALAEFLLNHGAEIDGKDGWGWTPLRWAVESRSRDAVRLLLKRHADADVSA